MKFATAALLGLASASDLEYMTHLNKYGKSYLTLEEYQFRKAIFEKNKTMIEEHNANPGEHQHTLGENHMMDWTEDEYKKLLGFKGKPHHSHRMEVVNISDAPNSVDWRSKGAVTPVKN